MEIATDHSQLFHVKEAQLNIGTQSIVLQNENGPCALLAIINFLILNDTPMAVCVANHQDAGIVEETTLQVKLGEIASQKNIGSDHLSILFEFLPKLSQGLDVNPKFDGTFAASPEIELFKMFDIELVHGWVIGDLEGREIELDKTNHDKLTHLSYEQACAIQMSDERIENLDMLFKKYPTQMTPSGYIQLCERLESLKIAVLFWNNHFSTIVYKDGKLYTLVTDLGFLRRPEAVWEELDLHGAGHLCDGSFKPQTN